MKQKINTHNNSLGNLRKRLKPQALLTWFLAFAMIFGQVAALTAGAESSSAAYGMSSAPQTEAPESYTPTPTAQDEEAISALVDLSTPEITPSVEATASPEPASSPTPTETLPASSVPVIEITPVLEPTEESQPAASPTATIPAVDPLQATEQTPLPEPTQDSLSIASPTLEPGQATEETPLQLIETPAPTEAASPEPTATASPSLTPSPTPTATDAQTLQALSSGIFTYELIADGVRILGFVEGMEQADPAIPDQIDGQNVTEIGERAFMSAGLTSLALGANLHTIGEYAFTDNSLTSLTLPASLTTISAYAFRDNQISSLDLNQLQTLGEQAFANNRLASLDLGSVVTIGNSAFINNQLETVSVPASVTSFGTQVFAYNDRYVVIETSNPLIQTEVVPNGFGHVVNPVVVTVHLVDQATDAQIVADVTVGNDLTRLDGVVLLNEEKSYTPPLISGYTPVLSPVLYTPDSTTYEITVYYQSTSTKPVIDLVSEPKIAENGDGSEAVLLSFVKATDLNGVDISASIEVEPKSVDTTLPGGHMVTYTVTDSYGNVATRTVSVLVGTDWSQYPIGNGWVLGDFIYQDNQVLGFSPSGLTKVAQEKRLILPHINPADGTTVIDTVGVNLTDATSFRGKQLTSVADFADNILRIEGRYSIYASPRDPGGFGSGTTSSSGNLIETVDLPNLEYAGRYAFDRNRLTSISFPKLKFAGSASFAYQPLQSVYLPELTTVDVSGFHSTQISNLSLPKLQTTESAAFMNAKISTISLPSLTTVGANTFATNALTSLTEEMVPSLRVISNGAFRDNAIASIYLPQVTDLERNAFQDNDLTKITGDSLASLRIIGATAFQRNNLTELTIPNLASVGTFAFNGNPGLPEHDNNVVIWTQNDEVPSKENYLINPKPGPFPPAWTEADFVWDSLDHSRVLGFSSSGKQKLPSMGYDVVLPDRAVTVGKLSFTLQNIANIAGANVEVIEASAFYNNKLTSIDFPNLREVGDSALQSNSLTSVDLSKVEKIGVSAFQTNRITALDLPVVTEIGNYAFAGNLVATLSAPEVLTIGVEAFFRQPIKILELPKVTDIGTRAFSNAGVLESVTLPQVLTIGLEAFESNIIKDLYAPNVQTIGDKAFNSNRLTLIELPNVQTIGSQAFRYNRITEAYLSLSLTTLPEDAFSINRDYNATRKEVMVFLPGGQNPNGLQDGVVNGVRQHIVNPTKVTVRYLDTNGQPVAEPFSEYIFSEKTYNAINIFNYKPEPLSVTVQDERKPVEVEFIYTNLNLDGMQTEGVEIYQHNELDLNTSAPRIRYYIGNTMVTYVYLDLTGFSSLITDGVIRVYYDPAFIDEGSISIPTDSVSSIKSVTVKNGVIEIALIEISGGFSLEIPIEWEFKQFVTPDNYRMEVNALMANGDDVYSVAEPIYLEGYYNKPYLTKRSPLNIPGYDYGSATSATNGPRLMGEMTLVRLADDTYIYAVTEAYPVEFSFSINRLERYVNKAIITDTLPKYIAINDAGGEEERVAVFDQSLNLGWVLSPDGTTVTQVAEFAPTAYPSASFKPLYLLFPGLKSGHNVLNNAKVELFPDKQGLNESTMHSNDDLSIYAVRYEPIKYEGDPRFDKDDFMRPWYDGNTAYFFDMQSDREKIIPYFLRVSSMAQLTDLVNVRITDYGLDDRLYYYGVSFPQSTTASGGLTVSVVAYAQLGAVMNPAGDAILQSVQVSMNPENNVVFDESIAKSIDYIQIVLPASHKVFSALEFLVDTKLRDPNISHYTIPALSDRNVFTNHAVMSGDLYLKGTTVDASVRTDPLLNPSGLIISQYDPAWDNIPGNYMWHEQAIVNIRDYSVDMGVGKSQSYPTNDNVYPGQEGTYTLRLRPFVNGGTDEALGQAVVREVLTDFVMIDLLPAGLILLDVTPSAGFVASSESRYRIVNDYNGTGRTAIIFEASELNAGVFNIATIRTMVDPGTEDGQVTNEVFVTFQNPAVRKVGTFIAPPGHEGDGNE